MPRIRYVSIPPEDTREALMLWCEKHLSDKVAIVGVEVGCGTYPIEPGGLALRFSVEIQDADAVAEAPRDPGNHTGGHHAADR